jgi:patatin-related protein
MLRRDSGRQQLIARGIVEESRFETFDRQDVRVAVVMNGGVSLAVWISGVAIELHHLVQASRSRARAAWPEYAAVLDLLHATARVDVIAGTSAGGLNGGFLALGLLRDCDLSGMRDLWKDHGDLDALLRDPLERGPASLLQGDDYFLPRVREAYREIWRSGRVVGNPGDPADGEDGDDEAPIELLLTGTLWDGRRSSFTDDMGIRITEIDYDATFRFSNDGDLTGDTDRDGTGDLRRETVIEQLAVASRCTSSFPGAFEPHWVTSAGPRAARVNDRWRSSGGLASFGSTQYVIDGGVLLNKPIRPALEAIYRQAASDQVRRVLAYVVPDPGELRAEDELPQPGTRPAVPTAQQVLLGVLTRLRSTDSVSRELTEIRERNKAVGLRRRARDRLATAMAPPVAQPLAERSWEAYREIRIDNAARTVGALIAAGQTGGDGLWSQQELVEALRRGSLPFVPDGTLEAAVARAEGDWNWGQTTVKRLGEMTVDVLKRAIWLAPLGEEVRERIKESRRAVHGTLVGIRADRRELNAYWTRAAQLDEPRMPKRDGAVSEPASSDNLSALDGWLDKVLEGWAPQTRQGRLYGQALALAEQLRVAAGALAEVSANPNRTIDPDGVEAARLRALTTYLFQDATGAEDVLHRMLMLDVVQLAFAGAADEVEQEVELVQVSSLTPQLLTGVQQHHFGAFYRPSWRVNDWLRGRLDAAEQLMRILLSPERLRQLGYDPTSAFEKVREIAVGPEDSDDRPWFEAQWAAAADQCEAELRDALGSSQPDAQPAALGECAKRVALPLQTRILREELPALARSIQHEPEPVAASGRWAASLEQAVAGSSSLPAAALWQFQRDAEVIGKQRITEDVGTDTFARTASHAAAVFANTIGSLRKPRLVATMLSALRGYALVVWAMIRFATLRSGFGANAVSLAVAGGAVLLAVTMVVPGIPVGLTMLGVLLILAGATTSALRERKARRVGLRLLAAGLLALAALAGLLWYDWQHSRSGSIVWGVLIKTGVALGIVLLGWWVASVKPRSRSQP